MSLDDVSVVTPYSTITPYATGFPDWIGEEDQERIQSYTQYDLMYWNNEEAFQLVRRPDDGAPIYLPTPRTIVNTTAHFLLKGLKVTVDDSETNAEFAQIMKDFLKREKFYSRFNVAKKAGVCRGDWVFHITGDPADAEGARVSLTSVDPASYFPIYSDDDPDVRIGVRLVEQLIDPEDDTKTLVKILEYGYELDEEGKINEGRVWRQEDLWEMEGWNNPEKAKKLKTILPLDWLPTPITQIPVYHFKNGEWDGEPFGSSELRGYERVFEAINQSASDEDLALALTGLGVYATDAGRPVDEAGREKDWEVYPGVVLEVPGATMFKRVEGISTVTPVQDHLEMLKDSIYESSGVSDIALGQIDSQIAESGIALAIKFLPMQSKIEDRDLAGLDVLNQMFYDLKFWFMAYERWNYLETEIILELGDKLPINRAKRIEELNNMMDRKVISRAHFRREMVKLGYEFPDNIGMEILEEELLLAEVAAAGVAPSEEEDEDLNPGPGGRQEGAGDTLPGEQQSDSNNTSRVNESKGTEIDTK